MTAPFRTLTPDAQYHDDALVEREAAAGLLNLVTLRERGADAIPDAEWETGRGHPAVARMPDHPRRWCRS